mmetsp:Transcript_34228/g.90821  ORF Transcript_34228/g.90821 Transcript_34228/m.90821 type:complete len:212 (-) Transcript_34228:155-790(-)
MLHMPPGRSRFFASNEAGTNPNARGAEGESCGERPAVEHAAAANNDDVLARERRPAPGAGVDAHGQQHAGRDLASVSAALAALGADHVDARIERFQDVVRMAHHVHDRNARSVELVHHRPRRHPDCADEECSLLFDDDVGELVQLAMSIVMVRLAGTATNLRNGEVDAEWGILVIQQFLHFVNFYLKHFGCHCEPTDCAYATGIGYSRHQL